MTRLLCLLFILTNSVMAQAAFDAQGTNSDLRPWQATHAGATEIDGLPVLVALEKTESQLQIPDFLANGAQTLIPLVPAKQKRYRLVIVSTENPSLRASFELEGRNLRVGGAPRFALVSQESSLNNFRFTILSEEDGTLLVSFSRPAGNSLEQGTFSLAPMAQIMGR